MSSTVTVRDLDLRDKSWLKREARRLGISMEEFIRRLIRDERARSERDAKHSEAFKRYFGPEHGVELPPPARYGYRPVELTGEPEGRTRPSPGSSTRTSSRK